MGGLISYGAYVPAFRMPRASIGAALGSAGGTGTRSVASYDEDVSSMAVEAARVALRGLDVRIDRLYFATSIPPYLDKTNAALIHAALDLDRAALAVDMGGAPRSAMGALLAGVDAARPTLVVSADVRTGLPGSSDERDGGDAAAALAFGPDSNATPVLATVLATASTTDELLDRWRLPGAPSSRVWEERFAEHVYGPLAEESLTAALKEADITADDVDHLIVTGLAGRAVKALMKSSGVRREALVADHAATLGNPGAAQPGLLLADVLDRAEPGQTIALVQLADGATTVVFRTTAALLTRRAQPSVADRIANPGRDLLYTEMLSWRELLEKEPPRRPNPESPAGPPTHRTGGYKHAFRASKCTACGVVNVPPSRICFACRELDQMQPHPMSDVRGTVATFTVDRLAFTPAPPMVAVVVDFDGGGRFRCELADAGPDDVAIGTRVEVTFRRLLTADGVHNYFWKARPLRAGEEDGT